MLVAIGLAGCAPAARLIGDPAEYRAYRETRARYTTEQRLVAATKYLEAYPEGAYAGEVRARFEVEEAAFYDAQSKTSDDLEWYLHVLPDGPHAQQAHLTLSQTSLQEHAEAHDELLTAGRNQERRLKRASRSRTDVTDTFNRWVTAFSTVTSWGRPTSALPGDMTSDFRRPPDAGRCNDIVCTRVEAIPFQVPIAGGGLDERAAVYEVLFTLDNGGVRMLTLRGPALFSRVFEASRGKPVEPDEQTARAEAVSYALDLVGGTFEATLPEKACAQPIDPPTLLKRSCGGVTLTVKIGDDPSQDDVVQLEGRPGR